MLTTLVRAPTYDLTTLETVKTELEISGTADDAFLGSLIQQSSGTVANYCDRVLALETVRETFRLDCYPWTFALSAHLSEPLRLERRPIVEILSIYEDDRLLDALDYEVDFSTGQVWRLAGDLRAAWYGVRLAVEYRGGYALLEELPYEIERCCIDLIKRAYFSRSRDPAQRSEQILDIINSSWTSVDSATTVGGLPVDIAQRLDGYRRIL